MQSVERLKFSSHQISKRVPPLSARSLTISLGWPVNLLIALIRETINELYSLRPVDLFLMTYLLRCGSPRREGDGSGSPAAADTAESHRQNLGICHTHPYLFLCPLRAKCLGENRCQTLVLEGERCCSRYSRVSQGESRDLPHLSFSLPLSITYQVSG